MYRLQILSVGKTKEEWLEAAIAEYLKRLQATATIEFRWAKNDDQLNALVHKEEERGAGIIALDASGKMMDSERFSSFLLKRLEDNGARLTIVIGGAEGLPKEIKTKHPLVSLSSMTFTHQVVRLILVEQIYRAFEIAKGSKYHK